MYTCIYSIQNQTEAFNKVEAITQLIVFSVALSKQQICVTLAMRVMRYLMGLPNALWMSKVIQCYFNLSKLHLTWNIHATNNGGVFHYLSHLLSHTP